MKTDLFQHELTNTSAVFGRKSEVRVVFQGDGAKTDHSTIWLPSLPKGVEIGKREQGIFRGYTDHEAGHVRHTDRKALEKAQPKFKANPRLHGVWNALEDVWLERRVMDEYPGARENLAVTAQAVDEQALKDIPASDPRWKDDRFVGAVALTWEGRKGYGHDTGAKCLERCSPELQAQLPVWVKALDACRKTQDVLDLAEVVHGEIQTGKYTDLEEWIKDRRSKNGEGDDGEGEEDSEEGGEPRRGKSERGKDGVGGEDAENDGDIEMADEDETSEQQEFQGGTAGGDRHDVHKDYSGRPDPGSYEGFSLENLVHREAARLKAASGGRDAYRPWSTVHDKWHTRHDARDLYGAFTYGETMRELSQKRPAEYQKRLANASGQINVVRRKLERVLLSQQNRGWESGHEFGKLDSRRLVGAYRADPKVYKAREPVAELDTAVQLLVDLSGSMCGEEASLATDVIIVLSEVLAKVNIPFEVLGFSAKSGHYDRFENSASSGRGGWHEAVRETKNAFSRYEPIDMFVFKAFDERFAEAKSTIGNIWAHAGGNNIDGESLMYAYPRLAKRAERRKVLMTLSDGAPACGGNCAHLHQHLKDVVKTIARSGVECIGIGIHTDAVEEYYPRNVVVHNLEDLGRNAIHQLARVLVGERYVVDNAELMKGAA